ncbi:MAG: chemotaxis protein CheA [Bacteroidales bacterium]|nr:chemotaxis protein CheA [Bacteroidales bacterium]
MYREKTGRELTKNEIKEIFIDLDKTESLKIEKPKYVDQKDEVLEKETTLKDIERKTVDLFKKTSTIRVAADKLDDLITNVSEFVTLYSQISLYSKSIENKELNKSIQSLGKLSKKLRDNALELRLVEINELTVKLHRLIRDLSLQLGKEINFITEGTDTELDKTIIDNLEEPLMHIIRNSLDHGIESKENRKKMNKPDKGIVRLTAFYSGANVFIQIQDDGKGIDLEVIRQKAIEKGLINANNQLTNREVYDLLFLPGFTTAENVSKISGRGVGMDVVKQKINELRGEIEVDSEIDLGTSVTIKLPLTLSIIDTMKVKIENLLYLIPLSVVETCIRIKYEEIANSIKKQFEYEGNLLPVIQLRDEFNLVSSSPVDGRIVIVKQYEKKYCILVDEVLGDHQAVVKPLGDLHKKHEYFSGASIMGDGSLALILDTGKIYTMNKEIQNIT